MTILIGLLIIAIGSFGQSSSYVPIKKVREWSWESFWLTQGIFAWILFPLAGTLLAIGGYVSLGSIFCADGALLTMFYGVLWGIGGLTFGLSMRYLGVAMGQSIALGTCAGLGTLLPAILRGTDIFSGAGLTLLIGVCITLVGIAVIGYAGSLRSANMTKEEKTKAIKDFALGKGLFVAILAGLMSACFALGLDAGAGIKNTLLSAGAPPLFAGLPVVLLVTMGGFVSNAAYCLFNNFRNRTFSDYTNVPVLLRNVLFCALAGGLWYSQFFGLEIGKSMMRDSAVLLAFSWSILMSLNVLFSNLWGVWLKEWKGVSRKTLVVLISGLIILVFSLIYPNLVAV